MSTKSFTIMWLAAIGMTALCTSAESAIDVQDTFSRPDSDDLDVTEVGGFEYLETGTVSSGDVAWIVDEQLEIFGVDGPGGTGPGIALIDVNLADLDISFDMRYGELDDPINSGTNNSAGFFLRRPGPDVNYNTGEGQVDLNMLPGGAFLIRETHLGNLETLYFDTPFPGGTTDNFYSPPGTLPASIAGLPFDADQDGVLEEGEPFNLGASLTGDLLTVKINGEDLFDVSLSRSAPASEISMAGLYKNRFTSAGGLDPAQPNFDNLIIRGTDPLAPPPPPPILHVGDTDPLDEDWEPQNGAVAIAHNGPVNDGGVPAWNIEDDSDVGGSREAYIRSLSSEQLDEAASSGWTMHGELRFVGVDDEPDGAVELSVFPESNIGYVLWFGADEFGSPIVAAVESVTPCCEISEAVIAGDGYHAYEMVFDPDSSTVDVFVDDKVVLSSYEGVEIGSSINRILWGSNHSAGTGNANYRRVEFTIGAETRLQAGDADQDLDFDQLDLIQVQIAAKYLTGQAATWGEGDWNGAPGGTPGNPPPGDGQFNQVDIIAALGAGIYLTGPYGAVISGGTRNDGQTSVVYDVSSGEVMVDAPAGIELTSINIDSAAGIFTGEVAENLGGSFDNDADGNVFKATFGGSFGSLSFGNIAASGLTEEFLLTDLTVVGSLSGGGSLGEVDLVYVPEPNTAILVLCVAMLLVVARGDLRSFSAGACP